MWKVIRMLICVFSHEHKLPCACHVSVRLHALGASQGAAFLHFTHESMSQ